MLTPCRTTARPRSSISQRPEFRIISPEFMYSSRSRPQGESRRNGGGTTVRRRGLAIPVAMVALLLAAPAIAQFPGTTPGESVRINTPNDPGFDHCEPDDEQGPPTCTNVFDQQYERFGFAPHGSHTTGLDHNPSDSHVQGYMVQTTTVARNPLGQVPGVSADRAWKYSTGDPSVQVAILD